MRSTLLAVVLIFGCMATCWADAVGVGYIDLEQDPVISTNVDFGIYNITGFGGSPDFPVTDALNFTVVKLTLTCANAKCSDDFNFSYGSSGPHTFDLSDIGSILSGGSGFVLAGFDSADTFSSAVLTLNFDSTNLTLDDGSGVVAPFSGSGSTIFTFNPANGSEFVLGDFAVLTDPSAPTSVPEPGSLLLLVAGLGAMVVRGRCKSKDYGPA